MLFSLLRISREFLIRSKMSTSTFLAVVLLSWAAIATFLPHFPAYLNLLFSMSIAIIILFLRIAFRREPRRVQPIRDSTAQHSHVAVEDTRPPDGPQLELHKGAEFGQSVESWAYYPLILKNTRTDYPYPALGIRAALFFEHVKGRTIEVPHAILLKRDESRFTKELQELRNNESVELIVVATPYRQEFYALRSYPLNLLEEDKLSEGAWTCKVIISGTNFESFSKTYQFTAWSGRAISLVEKMPNA